MKLRTSTCAIAFFLAVGTIQAEQIIMRNGQVFTGQIVSQNRTDVVLDTANGRVVLKKADIRRITYGPTPEEQKKIQAEALRKEEARKAEEKKAADLKAEQERKAAEEKKAADDKAKADKKKAEDDRMAKEKLEKEKLEKETADRLKEDAKKNEKQQLTDEQMRQRIREEVKKELELAEQRKLEEARRREELQRNTPTRLGAFVRSMVLPGWGQYYQGRKAPAFAYGLSFAGLAAVSRQQDVIYNRRRSLYQSSSAQFLFLTPYVTRLRGVAQDDATAQTIFFLGSITNSHNYDRYKSASGGARAARGALLGLYGWVLADTLIFAPRAGVSLRTEGDTLKLAFTQQF
ncbi:MAG: hypothetical protein JNM27_18885 [Leptospirales bacterium]|nr:hypothetical protein [Leptospirales bacterium]